LTGSQQKTFLNQDKEIPKHFPNISTKLSENPDFSRILHLHLSKMEKKRRCEGGDDNLDNNLDDTLMTS